MAQRVGYKQTPEHVARRMAARTRNAKLRDREVSREWLTQKYVIDGLGCPDIGRLVGRDPKTIFSWLRHYGVPTRPRGSDTRLHFPKGCQAFLGQRHTSETKAKLRALRLAQPTFPHLVGGRHWIKDHRGLLHPNWKGGVTPERAAFYSTREWKAAVVVVWSRADARCERCGVDHRARENRGTFHVHHIAGFAVRELRADPTNLRLLCAACHRHVHSRDNVSREFLTVQEGASQ